MEQQLVLRSSSGELLVEAAEEHLFPGPLGVDHTERVDNLSKTEQQPKGDSRQLKLYFFN